MRDLVTGEGSGLKTECLHWDGENSLASRQRAAADLFQRMRALEERSEPYCVVGHSHGGSVVHMALTEATRQADPLPGLKHWITIGTPFLELRTSRVLFFRLGLIGKAFYITTAAYLIGAALAFYSLFRRNEINFEELIGALFVFCILPVMALSFSLSFLVRLRDRRLNRRLQQKRGRHGIASFTERWLGLWHLDDEAIGGLTVLGKIDQKIFDRKFAIPILTAMAVPLLPLLFYMIVSNSTLALAALEFAAQIPGINLSQITRDGRLIGDGHDIGINYSLYLTIMSDALSAWLLGYDAVIQRVVVLVGGPLVLFLMAIVTLTFVNWVARPLSWLIAANLDKWTWSALRQNGYGSDIDGQQPGMSAAHPIGSAVQFHPLPGDVAQEITDFSSRAASATLTKARGVISDIAFSGQTMNQELFEKHFSWHELIHTSYFDSASLRRLIAYTISECEGFAASHTFTAHQDYEMSKSLLEQVRVEAAGIKTEN